MEKRYVVVDDRQNSEFNIGFSGTAEDFKKHFTEFLPEEWHKIYREDIAKLEGREAVEYIGELFDLIIEEEK